MEISVGNKYPLVYFSFWWNYKKNPILFILPIKYTILREICKFIQRRNTRPTYILCMWFKNIPFYNKHLWHIENVNLMFVTGFCRGIKLPLFTRKVFMWKNIKENVSSCIHKTNSKRSKINRPRLFKITSLEFVNKWK